MQPLCYKLHLRDSCLLKIKLYVFKIKLEQDESQNLPDSFYNDNLCCSTWPSCKLAVDKKFGL